MYKAGVVNKINCINCGGKSRLGTYKNSVKNKNPNASALARHYLDSGHHFHYENVEVMASKADCQKETVLKMLRIKKAKTQ